MNSERPIGPPRLTFLTLVFKTAAGLAGGIAGTLVMLVIFLLASSILRPTLTGVAEEGAVHPLFVFVFMAMIFLTALASNVVSTLFFTFIEHEKYERRMSAIYQIFIVNVVILVVSAPLYIASSSLGLNLAGYVAALQILMSSLASMMILEIIGNTKYALVGVYGVIFGILISSGILFTFYQFVQGNPVLLLFLALPVIWSTLAVIGTIIGMLYHWLYSLYGVDFLATATSFGTDYGEPEEEEEKIEDVTGGEFLQKH